MNNYYDTQAFPISMKLRPSVVDHKKTRAKKNGPQENEGQKKWITRKRGPKFIPLHHILYCAQHACFNRLNVWKAWRKSR